MPIVGLLRNAGFTPAHCQAMAEAFEGALVKLGLTDRSDPLVELVAKKIIELGQQGLRDPIELRDAAIERLTKST